VVTYVGDGSAMYSIQALWTTAHHKLPITTVICNNGGYRIIKQRLKAFHKNDHFIGMDFVDPPVDFTGLARSLGMKAERITDPDAIEPAVKASIASGGPTLLEVMVDPKV
jgi:benzoylformate decarboxylase